MVKHINRLFEIVQDDAQVTKWIKEFSKVRQGTSCFALLKVSGASIDSYSASLVEGMGILSKLELCAPLVYGWGESLTKRLKAAKIPYEWHPITGDRITTPEAMKFTLQISREYGLKIQEACQKEGVNAELLEGVFTAKPQILEGVDYPHCNGEIEAARIGLIMHLINKGIVPIISPIGYCSKGRPLNINADTAGRFLAEQIRPLKYCLITNTGGVLDNNEKIIPRIELGKDLPGLVQVRTISGGMEKKLREVEATLKKLSEDGLKHSVQMVHPKNLVTELFTDCGKGTYIEL